MNFIVALEWCVKEKNYRKMFAVVSQNPYLFFCTIRENIDLNGGVDESIYEDACRKSGAYTFISKLPNRDDSTIGQNGAKLSGGERKKLAIARAIIKNSPFIIMDEATAGIDIESDKYLYEVLENELKEKTVIIITHSRHHLKSMDRVYCFREGTFREVNKEELD